MTKKDKTMARSIARSIAESALINGDLKIEDFSDLKVVKNKLLKILPQKDENLFFTIIHQPTLLEEGIKFAKKKKYEHAYIFYATYFEHFINEVIDIWAKRNSIRYETSSSLIKRIGLEDKYTWLLDLLKLPKFKVIHFKCIKNISEKRNSYIHYKYKPEAANASSEIKKTDWEKDYRNILKAISYTKRYRTKVVFGGHKNKFKI